MPDPIRVVSYLDPSLKMSRQARMAYAESRKESELVIHQGERPTVYVLRAMTSSQMRFVDAAQDQPERDARSFGFSCIEVLDVRRKDGAKDRVPKLQGTEVVRAADGTEKRLWTYDDLEALDYLAVKEIARVAYAASGFPVGVERRFPLPPLSALESLVMEELLRADASRSGAAVLSSSPATGQLPE